jgi:hypothetical protein
VTIVVRGFDSDTDSDTDSDSGCENSARKQSQRGVCYSLDYLKAGGAEESRAFQVYLMKSKIWNL